MIKLLYNNYNTQNLENFVVETVDNFTFDTTGKITKYIGTDISIIIPFKLNNTVITSIGANAFNGKEVVNITFELKNNVSNITSIGLFAFANCSKLESITLPESIVNIDNLAFGSCHNLININLPNSITNIGKFAFSDCKSLEKIIIPDNLNIIAYNPFPSCDKLSNFNITTFNQNYTILEGVLFDKYVNTLIAYPSGKINTDYSIPNTVKTIAQNAFSGCKKLFNIIFPNSITAIEGYILSGCINLKSITFLGDILNITNLSTNAFNDIENTNSINILSNIMWDEFGWDKFNSRINSNFIYNGFIINGSTIVGYNDVMTNNKKLNIPFKINNTIITAIGADAFSNKNLTNVNFLLDNNKSYITNIGPNAFYNCTSLTSIILPNSITTIDYNAFYNCTNLKSIIIPDSVSKINEFVFINCSRLTSIMFTGDIANIIFDDTSFNINGSQDIVNIYNGVLWDDKRKKKFYYTKSMDKYINFYNVTLSGSTVINYKTQSSYIYIPLKINETNITAIDNNIFKNNKIITDVNFQLDENNTSNITSIGIDAFNGCANLKNINIPASVIEIKNNAYFQNPFLSCFSLTNIKVNHNNTKFSSDQYGVLFNKDKTELIQYPIGNLRTSYKIPDSVTSIKHYACGGLNNKITHIEMSKNLKNIDKSAFINSKGLTNIILPKTVTNVGYDCFLRCSNLMSIVFKGPRPIIDKSAFDDDKSSKKATIYHYGWTSMPLINEPVNFVNLKCMSTIPTFITYIDDYEYVGCNSLSKIIIPSSITSIGAGAFLNCYYLKEITFSGDINTINIETNAFNGIGGGNSINIYNKIWDTDRMNAIKSTTNITNINFLLEKEKFTHENFLFQDNKLNIIIYILFIFIILVIIYIIYKNFQLLKFIDL